MTLLLMPAALLALPAPSSPSSLDGLIHGPSPLVGPVVPGPVGEILPFVNSLSLSPPPDPYYGLLTRPAGQWGLVAYGQGTASYDHALILRGNHEFQRKARNLLFGMIRGLAIKEEDNLGNCMIPVQVLVLQRAISTHFYCSIYPLKRQLRDIVNEEGDVIGSEVLNDPEMEGEADQLASQFIAQISGDGLGFRMGAWGCDDAEEYGLAGSLGAAHSTGDGRDGD